MPSGTDRRRSLPQGCQIESPFSDEEWAEFRACARRGWATGGGLDNEFYLKIAEHGVTDSVVQKVTSRAQVIVAYEHRGEGRVGIWDSNQEVLVIVRESNGKAFNAFHVRDIHRYMRRGNMTNIRWLRGS